MTIDALLDDPSIKQSGRFQKHNNCLWIKDPKISVGVPILTTFSYLLYYGCLIFNTEQLPKKVFAFLKNETLIYLGETQPMPVSIEVIYRNGHIQHIKASYL